MENPIPDKFAINRRIREFMEYKGLTKYAFAQEIPSISRSTVYNTVEEKHLVSPSTLEAIAARYGNELNMYWVQTGNGRMLLYPPVGDPNAPGVAEMNASYTREALRLKDPEGKDQTHNFPTIRERVLVETVSTDGFPTLPLVNSQAHASYQIHHQEPEFIRDLPQVVVPLPVFKNRTSRIFQILGDSMEDTVSSGDWAFCTWLEDWPRNLPRTVDLMYVVVTSSRGILLKRAINRIERGLIRCYSDNESYQPFDVPVEEVQEIWEVKTVLGFNLRNKSADVKQRIGRLENEVYEIQYQLQKLSK